MDWSSLGPLAAKLAAAGAPTLGRLVGEALPIPFGGMIGELAGKAIASALGVEETPEAVSAAVNSTSTEDLQPRLAAAESEAAAKWAALAETAKADAADRTAQSSAINETMRTEIPQISWYHWRHLIGYVLVLFGVEAAALLPLVVVSKITATDMANVLGALMPITSVFAGLLGYIAQDTTKLKTAAITGEHAPNIVTSIVKAVKKK